MGNKYINPTGEGYQGVVRVTDDLRASIATSGLEVEWPPSTSIVAVGDSDKLYLNSTEQVDTSDTEPLGIYRHCSRRHVAGRRRRRYAGTSTR